MDTGETQPVFFKGVEAFRTNAESLADVTIDFDLKDEIYRRYLIFHPNNNTLADGYRCQAEAGLRNQ